MRQPEDDPACDPAYDREEVACPDCGGTGIDPDGTDSHPCDRCDGDGIAWVLA